MPADIVKCGGEEFLTYEVSHGSLGSYQETVPGPQAGMRDIERLRILDHPPQDALEVQREIENLVLGGPHKPTDNEDFPVDNPVFVGNRTHNPSDSSRSFVSDDLAKNDAIFYYHEPDLDAYDLYDRNFLRKLGLLKESEQGLKLDEPALGNGEHDGFWGNDDLWERLGLKGAPWTTVGGGVSCYGAGHGRMAMWVPKKSLGRSGRGYIVAGTTKGRRGRPTGRCCGIKTHFIVNMTCFL